MFKLMTMGALGLIFSQCAVARFDFFQSLIHSAPQARPAMLRSADVDGDGDVDLFTTRLGWPRLSWHENNGAGRFTEHVMALDNPLEVSDMQVADVNGDGHPDLLVSSLFLIQWFANDGTGVFTPQVILNAGLPRAMAVVDVDADGDVDVLAGGRFDHRLTVQLNDGTGQFTEQVIRDNALESQAPVRLAAADVDGDGDVDFFANTQFGSSLVYFENTGSLNFDHRLLIAPLNAGGMAIAECNGDGHLDLLVANAFTPGIDLYSGDGAGAFTLQRLMDLPFPAIALHSADVDGDGDADVLTVASDVGGLRTDHLLLRNDGAGQWTMQTLLSQDNPPFALTAQLDAFEVVDVDLDGWLDVLLAVMQGDVFGKISGNPFILFNSGFESL